VVYGCDGDVGESGACMDDDDSEEEGEEEEDGGWRTEDEPTL
jgi:hypothetical protein